MTRKANILVRGIALGAALAAIAAGWALYRAPVRAAISASPDGSPFPLERLELYLLVHAGLLAWIGLAGAWAGGFLASRPQLLPSLPLWSGVVSLPAWFAWKFSAAGGAVDGLLGTPGSWLGAWEQVGAFVVLSAEPVIAVMLAGGVAWSLVHLRGRESMARIVVLLVAAAPWLVLRWWQGGSLLGTTLGEPVAPPMVLGLLGHEAAEAARGAWASLAPGGGWLLAVIAGGALGGCSLQAGKPRPAHLREPAEDGRKPGNPGLVYLAFTVVYVAFLFYGCYVPFNFQPISLDTAWAVFTSPGYLTSARWGQADAVANIAMYIPLAFCAMGAWTKEGRRSGWWIMAPSVVLFGAAMSLALEFGQVFLPERTASAHDVIAQAIGSVIGSGAWVAFGRPFTRFVRGLADRKSAGKAVAVRLLYVYIAILLVMQLMPLTLTISVRRVVHKYRDGMITLWPLSDLMRYSVLAIVLKSLMYAPVGFLVATVTPRRKRPLLAGVIGGVAFAVLLEVAQVFVASRIATTTDLLLAAAGSALGALLAVTLGPRARGEGVYGTWWKAHGRWIMAGLTVAWVAVLLIARWDRPGGPASMPVAWERLSNAAGVPVLDMARHLGFLEGGVRIARELAVIATLGLFVRSVVGGGSRTRWLGATLVTIALAVALEAGRAFYSKYPPDLTLVLVGVVASALGVWAQPRLAAIFLKQPRAGVARATGDDVDPAQQSGPSEPADDPHKFTWR